ncbi:MAG TPA: tail fiber domain-containing protein, partial [Bacteroidales bacterium]|nr:tail fiber domain-containing protein [Bacteroidales bacterium]
GLSAGQTNTVGNNNTIVGGNANVSSNNLTNATAIGYGATVNASNKVVIGNASATTVGGYGSWTNYSDSRLKDNIVYKNDLGLDFIMKLKTASFSYKDDVNKRRRDGLIAQDVRQALKDLNLDFSGLVVDDDEMNTLNLSYPEFVIPLINAVQEQQKIIEKQELKLKQQDYQIQLLKEELEKIKTAITK